MSVYPTTLCQEHNFSFGKNETPPLLPAMKRQGINLFKYYLLYLFLGISKGSSRIEACASCVIGRH